MHKKDVISQQKQMYDLISLSSNNYEIEEDQKREN